MVSGASVAVTNTDTGAAHAYSTNGDGIYVAPFLQPGHYRVEATGSGFGKVDANNLTLLVGQTLTIDLSLSVQVPRPLSKSPARLLCLIPNARRSPRLSIRR